MACAATVSCVGASNRMVCIWSRWMTSWGTWFATLSSSSSSLLEWVVLSSRPFGTHLVLVVKGESELHFALLLAAIMMFWSS